MVVSRVAEIVVKTHENVGVVSSYLPGYLSTSRSWILLNKGQPATEFHDTDVGSCKQCLGLLTLLVWWKLHGLTQPSFCSLQTALLPSAEFIFLRVAYREAFWEELSRLIWRGGSIRRPLLFVHVIFFHSLPSRVGCSFQDELLSIFKLLCLVFGRYYLSSRTALENCVLSRFVLLTQAINLSRLS